MKGLKCIVGNKLSVCEGHVGGGGPLCVFEPLFNSSFLVCMTLDGHDGVFHLLMLNWAETFGFEILDHPLHLTKFYKKTKYQGFILV